MVDKTDGPALILSVLDRLLLMALLPEAGTIVTARIVGDLRKKIGFSAQETEALKLRTADGNVHWDETVATDKEIELHGFERKLVVERLQKLSQEEKLTPQHVGLWQEFVGPLPDPTGGERKPLELTP